MPPLSDKELEEQLKAAGNSLRQPPSTSDELLPLLDQIEQLLSKVEQSPSQSMEKALSPLLESLVAELLLKHVDIDVKVGVASCISEITRITAPDTPYEDEKMKEVFHLIVSSFEHLSDNSSRSYDKRVSILETVAKVRSCVIMLDLDCDQMIVGMFNHFLNSIRDFHDATVFVSMETIMTLLLDESEDISPDLLMPILATLKNDNEEALPSAKKLAEKVIQNCSVKLKPYLTQTLKALNASSDNYSGIVASTLDIESGIRRHSGENITENQKDTKDGVVEATSQEKDSAVDLSPKLVESNGVNENANLETVEVKVDSVAKRRGRKSKSKNPSIKSSKFQDDRKKSEQEPSLEEISSKDDSASGAMPIEVSKSLDDVKVTETQDSQSKALESEGAEVASPTESTKVLTQSKKRGRPKRKKLGGEETPSADLASKKASDGTDVSKEKKSLFSKSTSGKVTKKNKALIEDVLTKNDGVSTSDSEARSMEETEKAEDDGRKMEESVPEEGNRKKNSRKKPKVKESLGKDIVNSPRSPVKFKKDEADLVESPRIRSKIKQSLSAEKESATTDYNESLVDSKIRVWWPKDKMFYNGVISSFDSAKKKHIVLYSDGDHEVLDLKKERWEFLGDDSASDGEQAIDNSNPSASSGMKRKNKGSAYSETSSKRKKKDDSPKSESKSSSKSKNIDSKSGGKSGGKIKAEDKANGQHIGTSKSGKSDEDHSMKYKDQSPKSKGKSKEESIKASSKSIDDGSKTSNKSKGKTPQSSKSPNTNGIVIGKSSSSKAKDIDQTTIKASDSAKTLEAEKGKPPDAAKSEEKSTKSGRKRRR